MTRAGIYMLVSYGNRVDICIGEKAYVISNT
jgi:hypothetical protein